MPTEPRRGCPPPHTVRRCEIIADVCQRRAVQFEGPPDPPPRVFIRTYGCTFNQSDSDAIAGILTSAGFAIVDSEENADVILLNTCTVKGATEQKTIDKIKRLVSAKKRLVIAGCLPEANKSLVRNYAPNSPLLGTRSLSHAADAVRAALANKPAEFFTETEDKFSLPRTHGNVIARIPLAEGCLGACTYCQTKLARGSLHSYPLESILSEVRQCVRKGCKEIQLTAQDTGAYGVDIKANLAELLVELAAIPGDFRLRVGMLNPEHAKRILPQLLKAYSSPKLYKFAHIPVQCGSDKVLKSMRRSYKLKDFLFVIKAFRKKFPQLTLATDIIVGYPTETKADFDATLKLLKQVKFDIVNVSKFTPRPFTPAAKLKQLPNQEVKRRSEEASALCRKISLEKNLKLIGKTFRVLITEQQPKGFSGRTDEYRQVAMKKAKVGEFITAKITGATGSYLAASKAI